MEITAYVKLTSKPERRTELVEVLADAIAATRSDPNCHSVEVLEGIENVDDVLLVERWNSVEAHQRFISGYIEAGGLADILDLLATDIETCHYLATGL